MIARNLRGSGRAGFPHPALALGDNAHAAQGIRMIDANSREPAANQPSHPVPQDSTVLASPRERALPEPAHLEPEDSQRRRVHGHSVVANLSTHHRLQPLAWFGDRFVHSSPKFGFHLIQFRLQPFADRLCRSTVNRPLLLFFTQICVKPRKLNVSGFPSPRPCRWSIACRPNSRSRVFSGCSSRLNFSIRSVSSTRN